MDGMNEDFERNWQDKLAHSIEASATHDVREKVLRGGTQLSDQSPRTDIIEWSGCAISELETSVPSETAELILTACACRYPKEALLPIREIYLQRGDIAEVHGMLQSRFQDFLEDTLALDNTETRTILDKGWGLAGLHEGNTILATKIPKSGYLKEYLQEEDPQRRRELYCHCPRIRDAIKLNASLPKTYCYCGAGFYKDIWETILGEPIRVEVRSSVLQGDEVCTIAIYLPD
jgi:predicted hydrocarbon binding protein